MTRGMAVTGCCVTACVCPAGASRDHSQGWPGRAQATAGPQAPWTSAVAFRQLRPEWEHWEVRQAGVVEWFCNRGDLTSPAPSVQSHQLCSGQPCPILAVGAEEDRMGG